MATRVRSFSKINLGLAIGPSRPDGFHALTTLYQTLDAHDRITVEARRLPGGPSSIAITTNDERVPTDSRNTAWKMLDAILAGRPPVEVHVHIEKRLPVQGGLGAGSANAAAALIGLEAELNHIFTPSERLKAAEQVGSDVPLFLIGGAVLGIGRGEEVYPMPDLPETHCVIALPSVGVSTPQAFRDWDTKYAENRPQNAQKDTKNTPLLTESAPSDRLKELSRTLSASLCEPHSSGVFSLGEDRPGNPLLALVRTGIENDFEQVVFKQHPSLGQIKRILMDFDRPEQSALYAALSGSGSAVFGLYETEAAAKAAEKRLAAHGTASLRTRTLPREQYWATMVVEGSG